MHSNDPSLYASTFIPTWDENSVNAALLGISQAMARTKNRQELFTAIFSSVGALIPMDDSAIVVLDEDGRRWTDWTNTDNYHDSEAASLLYRQGYDRYLEIDPFVERALNETGLLTIDDFIAGGHPFAQAMYDGGLRQFMFTPLRLHGQVLGALYFDSVDYDRYSPAFFPLFEEIGQIISVAVANVLSDEKLLRKEKESAVLLSISEKISTLTSREDVFALLSDQVAQVYAFDWAGVFIINEERDLVYELLDRTGGDGQPAEAAPPHETAEPWRLSESHPMCWWLQEDVAITQLEEQVRFADGTPICERMRCGLNQGLKTVISSPLVANGKKIGAVCLMSKTEGIYDELPTRLFKNVASQLALAVSNLLRQEELAVRDTEKTLLLQISEKIADVRTKNQLYDILFHDIRAYFHFFDAGIVLFNSKQGYYDFAQYDATLTLSDVNHFIHKSDLYEPEGIPLAGSVMEMIVGEIQQSGHQYFFRYYDDFSSYHDGAFVRMMAEQGYHHGLMNLLRSGGRILGMFIINFRESDPVDRSRIPLLENISNHLSTAVSNILAYNEISDREIEKTHLLRITERIASVTSGEDLLQLVQEALQPLFAFDHYGLYILDREGSTHVDWVNKAERRPYNLANLYCGLPHAGSPIEWMMREAEAAGGPSVFDVTAVSTQFPDYPHGLQTHDGKHFHEALALSLKANDEPIGLFVLYAVEAPHFRPEQFTFFRSVVHSLSIAVANVKANYELQQRDVEKQLQIDVNNAVLSGRNYSEVLRSITRHISKVADCDIAYIRILDEKTEGAPFHYYAEKEGDDFLVRPLSAKAGDSGLNAEQINGYARQFLQAYTNPTLIESGDFADLIVTQPYLRILHRKLRVASLLLFPLALENERKAYLIVGSRYSNVFNVSHLTFIGSVSAQLSLSLDNRLAFYQIDRLQKMLEAENNYLQQEVKNIYNFEEIIGQSESLQDAFEKTDVVARTDSTVLLLGETGTGKELFARAIHNASPRSKKPLIKINCAAMPAQLIESELFGHERGAFTGAIERRIGKFELANDSTLFLDEIGELPLDLQSKLLRALQEREIERLGGNKVISTNVRIIAATNRDLEVEVAEGRFRSDLYFRLNVFPIHLPPLRERLDDLPLLVSHFLQKFEKKLGKKLQGIGSGALQTLMVYHFPGNIRELEHILERAAILSKTALIRQVFLPKNAQLNAEADDARLKTFEENERDYIEKVLKRCNGKIFGKDCAADILGLPPTTLISKMKKLGIRREKF